MTKEVRMTTTKARTSLCPNPEISPKTTMRTPATRRMDDPVELGGSTSSWGALGSGDAGKGGRGFPHEKHDASWTGLVFPHDGHVRRITAEHEGQRSASSATGASQKEHFIGGIVHRFPSTVNR